MSAGGSAVERRPLLLLLRVAPLLLPLLLLAAAAPALRRRRDERDAGTDGVSSSGSDVSAHDVDELHGNEVVSDELRFAGSSESDSHSSERLDVDAERT